MELATLKRGDGIVIRVGSHGTQYALVVSATADRAIVQKYLARGKRWTRPLKVYPDQVLRRANLGEYRPAVPCNLALR